MRRLALLTLPWACLGLLAGCTSAPPAPGPVPADGAAVAPVRTAPSVNGFSAFEREQTERAQQAEARGHWAQAVWAWELLTLLSPDDPQPQTRLAAARERARQLASAKMAAAETARHRGELDAAAQAYLEALALEPHRRESAQALRQVELERERRRLAARNARIGGAAPVASRRPLDEAADGMAAASPEVTRRLQSAREHAAILVAQGDLDGAIQLLRDALPPRPDAGARTQLADLYVAKAEALRRIDASAARAAVEAALALDRRHAGALAVQRQLAGPAAPASRATHKP